MNVCKREGKRWGAGMNEVGLEHGSSVLVALKERRIIHA